MNVISKHKQGRLMVRSRGFTLTEMLVAVALLLLLMAMASTVFRIAIDGTSTLTSQSEVDRSLRMLKAQLSRDLAYIDTSRSIMAIQGNPAPAYWSTEQKQKDQGDPASNKGVFNGIHNVDFSMDTDRENPTAGYDPLAVGGNFDADPSDDHFPLLPRADILMFITNDSEARSYVDPDVKSDGPVMVVYNHAELGSLTGDGRVVVGGSPPCAPDNFTTCGNDSRDDWVQDQLRPIPQLSNGGVGIGPIMDPRANVQDVAQDWHLARRSILLKNSYDPLENAALVANTRDRFAHVLSPTDPRGNQFAGYLTNTITPEINELYEVNYLNWILGGEMDVVAPAIGPISAGFYTSVSSFVQDFVFDYEVENRYFGGPPPSAGFGIATNDIAAPAVAIPGAVYVPNVASIPGVEPVGAWNFRGPLPAWWIARSHLDTNPPSSSSHRLGHYFLPNCASFKVEWTPNDLRLDQAGLPEVMWFDPFKEPGATRSTAGPLNPSLPADTVTDVAVQKPHHLDEFEMMAQKVSPQSSVALIANTNLGIGAVGFPTMGSSYLNQVHQDPAFRNRFGLSLPVAQGGVSFGQMNVAQFPDVTTNPSDGMVVPSYNTHTWYAKDLIINAGNPATASTSDPWWPKALRITVDLFDETGTLPEPVRYVMVLPVGTQMDRKYKLD